MMAGDILKYIPTSTVGKVTEVREKDGIVWVKLDNTGLYYDSAYLKPADKSEYKEVSFKEREKRSASNKEEAQAILDEMQKAEDEVDIKDFTPSGGG
jgi:hypothetical protein